MKTKFRWMTVLMLPLALLAVCQSAKVKGDRALRDGRYGEAIGHYSTRLRWKDEDAVARYRRGVAYEKIDRTADALADYGRAIELDPTDPMPRLHRARLLLVVGDLAEAKADLKALNDLAPTRLDAAQTLMFHVLAAQVAGADGQPAVEEEQLHRALSHAEEWPHLKHSPVYLEALYASSRIAYDRGEFDIALERLALYVAQKQADAAVVTEEDEYMLALLYYLNASFDEARVHFARVTPEAREQAARDLEDPGFFASL